MFAEWCIVTTMDKCFIVTTLLLVYLIAVVDSLVSYKCEENEENSAEKPDLRLELPSDISDKTSTKQYLCNITTNEPVKTLKCNEWENSFSTPCSASSTTEKENGKEVEKRYTLTEIILVALSCLLMGVILTTLVFVLYMKRTQRGCFSKDIKGVQGDSKQQSGSDMHFLTENVVVKKNDPNNPKSADSKNENKVEETQYQSLNSNQVGNDQQTYDQFNVNEPRSDRQGHQPSSSRLQQTANDYQIDQFKNLQHTNEYCRDSDIDGHNYFVLEKENMSQKSRAMNLGRPETHAEVGDEVKVSTLGTEDKQSDAAHEYFLLERFENGHNQD